MGFSRDLEPGNESTRRYYGPDPRVLFSDWFLESHCFALDKPDRKRGTDTLHLRFAPARKSPLVDVGGELVLDAHDLSLLQFSFALTNLPKWMAEDAAGGDMQFTRLSSGLWMTKNWAMWAPIGRGSRNSIGGSGLPARWKPMDGSPGSSGTTRRAGRRADRARAAYFFAALTSLARRLLVRAAVLRCTMFFRPARSIICFGVLHRGSGRRRRRGGANLLDDRAQFAPRALLRAVRVLVWRMRFLADLMRGMEPQ